MKKFIVILFLSLFSLMSIQTKAQVTQKEWTIENEGEWGSFYWAVSRSKWADKDGRYWYYIYSISNSLFNTKSDGINYDKAITFVKNVDIYMYEINYLDDEKLVYNTVKVHLTHFTCDYELDSKRYIAYFWSFSPNNEFKINYEKVSAYDKLY